MNDMYTAPSDRDYSGAGQEADEDPTESPDYVTHENRFDPAEREETKDDESTEMPF